MDHGQITSAPEIVPPGRSCATMTIRLINAARGLRSTGLITILLVGLFPREASGQG